MTFESFDETYLSRLVAGDPEVEVHFFSYFGRLISMKLRSRNLNTDEIEDIRQETFVRVLKKARSEQGIEQPERLGAFVNSVCNNVLMEHYRARSRNEELPAREASWVEPVLSTLVTNESRAQVRTVLSEMPARDRELLQLMFYEEKSREEICQRLKVDRDYLRVVLRRARQRFRAAMARSAGGMT